MKKIFLILLLLPGICLARNYSGTVTIKTNITDPKGIPADSKTGVGLHISSKQCSVKVFNTGGCLDKKKCNFQVTGKKCTIDGEETECVPLIGAVSLKYTGFPCDMKEYGSITLFFGGGFKAVTCHPIKAVNEITVSPTDRSKYVCE